ncbi:LytS/YhcK type 5TM receptor domain-containing protein [Jannaschia pohangensis]|uniref:5TMR of 5TMR-LYT n=1 Tax=Jannaschia pohangensis TaxID=390807 RepID=A0A1I3M2M0_9RHOB|nr:LytS/YhcK type 5TM receptor domain-containing protein [Jannaschia pohangensis]SFI91242.1 5TMR of 5TMR-LYT [Jannaschia pohangensis]
MADFSVLVHFLGSLALIAILAPGYQWAIRTYGMRPLIVVGLGLAFGTVSVFQMHDPVVLAEGLIVDMRNVPLALAGAFLGLRGMLLCLVVAAASRLQIGGIGAISGVLGMLLAGSAGVIWRGLTFGRPRRTRDLVALGVMMSSHLAAAFVMPMPTAIWFLSEAAPVLFGLNLLTIPLLAHLFDHSCQQLRDEANLRETATAGAGDGFMPPDALGWAMEQSSSVGNMQDGVVMVTLDVRHHDLIARFWGSDVEPVVWDTLRERLVGALPVGGIAGRLNETTALLVFAESDLEKATDIAEEVRQKVMAEPIPLRGLPALRVRADVTTRIFDRMPKLDRVREAFNAPISVAARRRQSKRLSKSMVTSRPIHRVEPRSGRHRDLFETYDALQATST